MQTVKNESSYVPPPDGVGVVLWCTLTERGYINPHTREWVCTGKFDPPIEVSKQQKQK